MILPAGISSLLVSQLGLRPGRFIDNIKAGLQVLLVEEVRARVHYSVVVVCVLFCCGCVCALFCCGCVCVHYSVVVVCVYGVTSTVCPDLGELRGDARCSLFRGRG